MAITFGQIITDALTDTERVLIRPLRFNVASLAKPNYVLMVLFRITKVMMGVKFVSGHLFTALRAVGRLYQPTMFSLAPYRRPGTKLKPIFRSAFIAEGHILPPLSNLFGVFSLVAQSSGNLAAPAVLNVFVGHKVR